MHGRPRKPPKPEDEASIAKAAKLRSLQTQLLQNHQNKLYTKEAVEVSSNLLEINPEVYTAWNYRKLAVESILGSNPDPSSAKEILDEELKVVESALRRNFKSYGAWHHRKWVLGKGFLPLDHEFKLVDGLLKKDSRNFLGWDYRRFIAALKNVTVEEELQFATDKIIENFSNYSAWHYRSILLSHLLKQKGPGYTSKQNILTEEFELVENALFTDPDDQSGWFYHLWLLDQTVALDSPLLIASWPVHDSNMILNCHTGFCISSSLSSFHLEHDFEMGIFPIILHFNQPVKGVNASTVTVQSSFVKNELLVWRPLSINDTKEAKSWVTYLNISHSKFHASDVYPVEVRLGHSSGIVSSSGSQFSFPAWFSFMLNLRSIDSEQTKRELDPEVVVWNDENFYTDQALLQDFDFTVVCFDQLRITEDCKPRESRWQLDTLDERITRFRELLSLGDCKIAKLSLARLLIARDAMLNGISSTHERIHSEEVLGLFADLLKMDPTHSRYYKDQRSLVVIDQVTCNKEALAKHCWHYKPLASSSHRLDVWLRLNKLSLSCIGFFERLPWVQRLDLSHNELRSIEGLEAMQVLTCLNLSNNKLSSFTVLEPLRLIKTLRVLDISHNEIGAHSIDTTRYLCCSPLSHAIETNLHFEEFAITNGKVTKYWEAILIFKHLFLEQLDVVGNPGYDDDARTVLVKVLPSLKWLDGTRVHSY